MIRIRWIFSDICRILFFSYFHDMVLGFLCAWHCALCKKILFLGNMTKALVSVIVGHHWRRWGEDFVRFWPPVTSICHLPSKLRNSELQIQSQRGQRGCFHIWNSYSFGYIPSRMGLKGGMIFSDLLIYMKLYTVNHGFANHRGDNGKLCSFNSCLFKARTIAARRKKMLFSTNKWDCLGWDGLGGRRC